MSLRGGWKIVIREEIRLKQIKYGFQVHKACLWKKDLTFRGTLMGRPRNSVASLRKISADHESQSDHLSCFRDNETPSLEVFK